MSNSLRDIANNALEQAKHDLNRDKHLIPIAYVVTATSVIDYALEFCGSEEKRETYEKLIAIARKENALAIVTVNDAYLGSDIHGSGEGIYVAVSGPDFPTWTLTVPYRREGDRILFGSTREATGAQFNLLKGWAQSEALD